MAKFIVWLFIALSVVNFLISGYESVAGWGLLILSNIWASKIGDE